MNAGVAVSLFLFLAVCAVFVGGIVVSALSKGRMNVVVVNEGGEEPSSLLYASGPILADVREIAAQAGDAVASVSDLASMDAFQGLAVAPGAQVLIVSENTAALSEGGLRAVTVALDRLSRAGFSLVGNFPGNAAAGDELERQLDLAAEVSAVRGIAPLDSPDTVEMLGDWLAADGAADLICWISGEKRGDKVVPQFWLMAPRAHDGDVGDVRERFETALHAISTPR